MPILRIRLLGGFNLSCDDLPVQAVNSGRLHSLLAYLLLHRDAPQPRQHLAYLFWPDATEVQARNNLRQLLHQFRHVLPGADGFLTADTNTLRWRDNASFRLDVADFEHALAQAVAAAQSDGRDVQGAALAEAVGLYRGDLLPSCYDEWIVPERERLRQRYLTAVALLVHVLDAQRDYSGAIQYAQAWIRHDPLAEDAYRALMRLLALTNDRAGALRVYQRCVRILRSELGVEPGPATHDIYQRLVQTEAPLPSTAKHTRSFSTWLPLVGRQREWERLQSVWQRANDGEPSFLLVSGEAGIGKSRLAEELLAWASQHGAAVAKARCYALEGQLSLAPVIDWLRSEDLQAPLAHLAPVWLTEVSRILPEILSQHQNLTRPEPIAEYGQRQRFFEALARAMHAGPHPVLLLIDDVQWCDPETLEWLHFLLRFDPSARLLVVATARAEELPAQHPVRSFLLHLGNTVGVTEIALEPLDAAETAKLAAQVVGRDLDISAALRLYRETEGNPLFVVETVHEGMGPVRNGALEATLLETSGAVGPLSLPPRVYAVIAGRLAQLSVPARELVGLAAAIGRAFTLDMLLRTAQNDEDAVVHALDELWDKRIVREQGAQGYDFTHDKLREVAYAAISAPQRRLLHQRIAQALVAAYAEDIDLMCGQIASHYERAGKADQAIPLYQRAAVVAQRVYANDNALSLLSRGLALLEHLPTGMKRDNQELGLLLAQAPILRVMKGWAAPEGERFLDRALALCDKIGNDEQRAQVLNGLQSVYVVQARLDRVQHVAGELEMLYQRSLGTVPPLFTAAMLTGARLHMGLIAEASARFAEILAVHDPDQMRYHQEAHGVNYMVHTLAWQAHARWCLGYPQSALRQGREAVQLARDVEQPFNLALAAAYLALLAQLGADDASARDCADDALAIATEYKAPYYRTWSAILVEYARAWERPEAESPVRLRDAITAFTVAGAQLRLPYFLSLLARVLGKAGRAEDGLAVIDEALAAARTNNERWWDAELHRMRGELLNALSAEERDVEAAYLRSIEIARAQQAKSLELRTATNLAQLWHSQQRTVEARRLLTDLCGWFTEGFDTPDLRAAQSFLAPLV
jgi:DNA-binding SARP family transcriptional activator/predicted ATPase